MKIAIDVSQIVYGTGVSVYTKLLVENLLKFDENNEYILFGGSLRQTAVLKDYFSGLSGNFKSKVFYFPPTLASLVWNRLHTLPVENLTGEIDVFHSSDWSQPPSKAFNVTTVHDLAPLKFPKLTHPRIVNTHLARLKRVRSDVDAIIAPSQSTKDDLIEFGIGEERITVIPEAPDPVFKKASGDEVEAVKRKYQIGGEYLLALGVNPRKNTSRIIEAFERVRPGKDLKLVIVGHPYMKLEPTRGVKIVGHVPLADLPPLYSGASCLVYPSFYEGFGFPILEAFSCQIPVVTSALGTMKEVGEGSAVLVDPYNIDSIVDGIVEALKNKKTLIDKGLAASKRYSWEKTAKETLKIYERAEKDL